MMKRAVLVLCFVLILIVGRTVAAEQIKKFESTININRDASVSFKENVIYDFSFSDKHDIERELLLKYRTDGGVYKLEIGDVNVSDVNGLSYNFSSVKQGDKLKIAINQAEEAVGNEQQYNINYRVVGAINYFDDHDELYWNVTGNEWPVSMDRVLAVINLPAPVKNEDLKIKCFVGRLGIPSDCQCAIADNLPANQEIVCQTAGTLQAGTGLTVVIGWPKGLVERRTSAKDASRWAGRLFYFLSVAGSLILLLGFTWYMWRTRHRRQSKRKQRKIRSQVTDPEDLST